jgi:hypothetical protein
VLLDEHVLDLDEHYFDEHDLDDAYVHTPWRCLPPRL